MNCLWMIGCVWVEDVENCYDELLIEYFCYFFKVMELINCYFIKDGDEFEMEFGYLNF